MKNEEKNLQVKCCRIVFSTTQEILIKQIESLGNTIREIQKKLDNR